MASNNGSYPKGINFELASRRRIKEPELTERLSEEDDSGYFFIAQLEDERGVARKLSRVETVRPRPGENGLFVVKFSLLDPKPGPGLGRLAGLAYFEDGMYKGEVDSTKVLRVSDGGAEDVAVVSGFFLNRPSGDDDRILLNARDRAERVI